MNITKNHRIALLDICLSDYFTGYSLPCLSVAIYGPMSCKAMAEAITDELNATYDYINPDNNTDIDKLYDTYIDELTSMGDEIFFQCEDISDIEDVEPLYAYFSIINPIHSNGMSFLNP